MDGHEYVIDARFFHGDFLFVGHFRVRIDSKHEGEKHVDKALAVRFGHVGKVLCQARRHRVHRRAISAFK